jgi:hypothetical protein
MMKRASLLLAGLLMASMFAFIACDDEPTQQEANEQFCDDVAELIASLRVIRDLDRNSTIEEVEDARDRAQNAYDNMIASAEGVVEANLDAVEQAYDDLLAAINEVNDEDTLEDALDEVDDELEELALQTSQLLNDVSCSGVGGSEGNSQE